MLLLIVALEVAGWARGQNWGHTRSLLLFSQSGYLFDRRPGILEQTGLESKAELTVSVRLFSGLGRTQIGLRQE